MTLSDGVPPANRLTDWNKICSDECAHTGERNLLVISIGYYRGNCRGCQSREAEPMHFWLELQHAQYQDLETCGDVCRRQSLYSKLSEPFLVDPFQDVAVLLATLRLEYRRIIPLREVLSVLQMQPWCGGRSGCGELAMQSARVNCCFLLGDGLNSISRNTGLTSCASQKPVKVLCIFICISIGMLMRGEPPSARSRRVSATTFVLSLNSVTVLFTLYINM